MSSIIPLLSTSVPESQARAKSPDRATTSDYKPSIPPRNRNRPRSHLFIKQSLEDIQKELHKEMVRGTHSRAESRASTEKTESYYSAASCTGDEDAQRPEHDFENDDSYFDRPLPNVPVDEEDQHRKVSRNDTIKAMDPYIKSEELLPLPLPLLLPLPLPLPQQSGDDDGEYEDIEEGEDNNGGDFGVGGLVCESQMPRPTSSRHSTKNLSGGPATPLAGYERTRQASATDKGKGKGNGKSKGKGKKTHKKEFRSFDIDTISQLLNVTKGTLIGSEFANLGMRTEEKRALERLVDSLSRLTADMVLDPERYSEGLRRLDKATRALEGF